MITKDVLFIFTSSNNYMGKVNMMSDTNINYLMYQDNHKIFPI